MKKISFFALLAFCALVSCQEELTTGDFMSDIAVTKSGDSEYSSVYSKENAPDLKTKPEPNPSRTSPSKWAVIINGGQDSTHNYKRYWNDCHDVYEAITTELNYPFNQVFCLVSDGIASGQDRRISYSGYDSSPIDYDGDGYIDVTSSATYNDIDGLIGYLEDYVSAGDEVLVVVTGPTNNGYIYLWGNDTLSPDEFSYQLDRLGYDVNIDVVLGTSASALYIDDLVADHRTIITATDPYSVASPYNSFEEHGNFLHYWLEAINTIDPTVSGQFSNGDGYLSSLEIFKYAEYQLQLMLLSDSPQINFGPDVFSWGHDLEGNSFVPFLTGPEYADQTYYGLYTVNNLPSSITTSWSLSGNLRQVASTNSSVTIAGNLPPSQYVSSGAYVEASFTDLGCTFSLRKDIKSVWKGGQYMNQNLIQGSNGVYYLGGNMWSGTYGFNWECVDPQWQITSQNNNFVYIWEGYTPNPVPLMVSFYAPSGSMIFIFDYVND